MPLLRGLSGVEFIDISNLDKEETRKIILGQEQYYLDLVFLDGDKPNSYNLLPIAGSSLDYKHT
jgi:predicted O-methyltransferase YrrM